MLRRRVIPRRGVGLLGAAAIGGTAYAVGSRKAKSQKAPKEGENISQPETTVTSKHPDTSGKQDKKIAQLKELAELQKSGVLSAKEFEKEKKKILEQ